MPRHSLIAVSLVLVQSLPAFAQQAAQPVTRPAVSTSARAAGQNAAQASQLGTLKGTARNAKQAPIPNATVRARNVDTGKVAGTQITDSSGTYTFNGLNPGNYVVEVLDSNSKVIATSSMAAVAAGAAVTTSVSVSAAAGGLAGVLGAHALLIGVVGGTAAAAGILAVQTTAAEAGVPAVQAQGCVSPPCGN
jgi:hypothetical protein